MPGGKGFIPCTIEVLQLPGRCRRRRRAGRWMSWRPHWGILPRPHRPLCIFWAFPAHLALLCNAARLSCKAHGGHGMLRAIRGGDAENPYMKSGAPRTPESSLSQRFFKELKQNWWLWASVVFAVILIGGLFIFRNNLYDNATAGLPFLAGTMKSPSLLNCVSALCCPCTSCTSPA